MQSIKEAIIVEGKYDKIKLSQLFEAVIISTNGFNVFRDEGKQKLIRRLAAERGIIIFTDSDRAGFLIRNFICGIVENKYIKHAYIPQIEGKEKRKTEKSKDGFLGVEGVTDDIIRASIEKSASVVQTQKKEITKSLLYLYGFCGGEGSSIKREKLLRELDLPTGITANALIVILNSMFSAKEFEEIVKNLTIT